MVKSEPPYLAKKIKLELVENTKSNETDVVSSSSDVNGITHNDNGISEEELNRTDPFIRIRMSTSWGHLLNKPPRLGLSRLERKVNILHEVTILEAEE